MSAFEAVHRYYQRQRVRATAWIALSEEAAIGANAALYDMNVKVPEEVSLLAYAGTARAGLNVPPLTTVDVDIPRHMTTAMTLLDAMLDPPGDAEARPDPPPLLSIIPPVLIERRSVAARK